MMIKAIPCKTAPVPRIVEIEVGISFRMTIITPLKPKIKNAKLTRSEFGKNLSGKTLS
jgi:hypothetical protein